MDNESEVIQRQMEDTRSALQQKLETFEQQVKSTVQDATEAVSGTVDSVKEAVQETVETVRDTVQDTMQTVKNSLDITQHFQSHPWTMFLGAAGVGFVATRLMTNRSAPTRRTQAYGAGLKASDKRFETKGETHTLGSWIANHYQGELDKVKELAVGALGAVVRDALMSISPPALLEPIREAADDATAKLGGRVIQEPILKSFAAEDSAAEIKSALWGDESESGMPSEPANTNVPRTVG